MEAPPGRETRPTSDRVREAVFSMVGSLGGVEGRRVADLFAGSGALGLEALSRGAAGALFVERDRRAADVIRANLATLGLAGPEVHVLQGDVLGHLASAGGTDVVFADPPYAFAGWEEVLDGLAGAGFTGLAVLEAATEVDPGPGWDVVRARRYGGTVVTLVRLAGATEATTSHEPPDEERQSRMSGAP